MKTVIDKRNYSFYSKIELNMLVSRNSSFIKGIYMVSVFTLHLCKTAVKTVHFQGGNYVPQNCKITVEVPCRKSHT